MTDDPTTDFDELEERLADLDFPTTLDDLVADYGDVTVDLGTETRTIGGILDGFEPTNERFENLREVRQALLTMADSDAVGRTDYTDRGGTEGERERDSF